jgi:hypothetical protein
MQSMAVVLNSFLLWVYWTYEPVVFAANNNNSTAKVTCFEDGTGVITNGTTLRVQFDYNFTEGSKEGEKTRVKTLSFSLATDLLLYCSHFLIKLKRNVNSQKRRRYI